MTDRNTEKTHYHGDEEIIERNIEQSKELIESRQQPNDDAQLDRVDPIAPENTGDESPPGQSNIPIGGTTGPNARGGTAKRHKTG